MIYASIMSTLSSYPVVNCTAHARMRMCMSTGKIRLRTHMWIHPSGYTCILPVTKTEKREFKVYSTDSAGVRLPFK